MRGRITYLSVIGRLHHSAGRLIEYARKEWAVTFLCLAFIVIAGCIACMWSPHQLNPDATAYFTIAQKYAHLDIKGALNSYWGPLFSWLLVPSVWLGIGLDAAARGISVLAAAATIILMYNFWRARGLHRTIAVSICLVAATLFTGWVLLGATSPDMIFTLIVALLAVCADRFVAVPSMRHGIWLGCTGAALYYAKGFGLYLFVAVIVGMALWQWWQADQRKARRQLKPAIITFALLVVPFMGALSLKYHQPTINSTGAYVHRAFGPEVLGGQPMLTQGPLQPPNDTATTVWEDPSRLIPLMPDWNPLQSRGYLSYFVHKTVQRNFIVTLESINDMGALCVAAVLLLLLGCLARGPGQTHRREYVLLTSLSVVIVGGYALVLTEPRYLWPVIVLALMGMGLWATRLEQKRLLNGAQALCASLIIGWLYLLPLPARLQDAHLSSTEFYIQAQDMRPYLPSHTKVIADNFVEYNACYYLNLHCYAVLQTPKPHEEAAYFQQLKAADIEYFVDYHTRDTDAPFQAFIQKYFVKTNTVSTPHTHPMTPAIVTLYRLR